MSKFAMNLRTSAPRVSLTALRHAIELDFLDHPGRFLLRLLYRFVKGWVITQWLCLTILGGFLLTGLLFAPVDFGSAFNSSGSVNAVSAWFAHVIWLFASVYGLLTGFLYMFFSVLNDGVKHARYLAEQWGHKYE